jgi:hypothetical protein
MLQLRRIVTADNKRVWYEKRLIELLHVSAPLVTPAFLKECDSILYKKISFVCMNTHICE